MAPARLAMTDRAGRWVTAQVGRCARSVNEVATELGCDWHTVNDAVIAYGTALVDDPDRIGDVTALGLDEVLFARLGRWRTLTWSTLDLSGPYRRVFDTMTPTAVQAADPFHLVKLANQKLDEVRRLLAGIDIHTVWDEADDRERRVLVGDLLDAVYVHPDHLRVVACGAPPLKVELAEVGLRPPAGMGLCVSEGGAQPQVHAISRGKPGSLRDPVPWRDGLSTRRRPPDDCSRRRTPSVALEPHPGYPRTHE